MMSPAVVCLALLSVATVSAQFPVPVPAFRPYPTVSSNNLLTNALSSSFGTSPATLYNPFIPVGGAAFGVPVATPCELGDGVAVQARKDDKWYRATIDGDLSPSTDAVDTYKVIWTDDETDRIPVSDIVAVCEFTVVPEVCEVKETLDITGFDTGIDVKRTIKYSRTLTCDCDGNQNPIAETCFRPSDMPSTCQVALYPCDVALQWDLQGVSFAGEKFPQFVFDIEKKLKCQCNVAGEPDFPTCIDLEAQEAWESAQLQYETAYEEYLTKQADALALYESEAAQQAIEYADYTASLAEGTKLQAAAYEGYIASLAVGSGSTIVQLASATPTLSTLVIAIGQANLGNTLSGTGPFTVFAPNDAAFGKVPTSTMNDLLAPENIGDLVDLLTYHVALGAVRSGDLSDGQKIQTVQGSDVEVSIRGSDVLINDAEVVRADIDATNGVVHIIDTVLATPAVTTGGPGPGR